MIKQKSYFSGEV